MNTMKGFIRFAGLVLALVVCSSSMGLNVTLHLNKDTTTSFFLLVHGASYNSSSTFALKNEIIHLDVSEPLELTVINNDTMDHTFTIDGFVTTGNTIAPSGTSVFNVSFAQPGTYRYYSTESYGRLAGASGMILVGYSNHPRFAWNLFDIEASLSSGLASDSIQIIPPSYQPELFYINGAYFPDTQADTNAVVNVSLGDTAVIGILNSGGIDHVLHFHGFHVEILQASISTNMIGWIKDTFPVKRGETMTVRMVADQTGTYPVHDHNLIAVTNAGLYPGGMITRINVAP